MGEGQRQPDGTDRHKPVKHDNIFYLRGVAMPPSVNDWIHIVSVKQAHIKEKLPFLLGIDGEYWEPELLGLVVPIRDDLVIVVRWVDGSTINLHSGVYRIYHRDRLYDNDSILMTAALVRNFIDDYLSSNSKLESEEAGELARAGNGRAGKG